MLKSKFFILASLFTVLAAACMPASEPVVTEEPAIPVTGVAMVQSVEIQIVESQPRQVNAIVRGQLPNGGCTMISSVNQTRDGNTIRVTLGTTTDPVAICTLAATPFEQVIPLEVKDLPPASYIINVNGIERSFELLSRDVYQFKQILVDTLNARNYDLLRVLMDESLMIAHWQSEGTSYAPDLAIEQLRSNLLNSGSPITADYRKNLIDLLGSDPVTIVGPEVVEASPLFVSGWGSEGKDESILFIARQPDGGLYWHGLLFAKDGFKPGIPITGNPPVDTTVYATPVQYIVAQRDVVIYNGPGSNYGTIGNLYAGQLANVTGTNVDGTWWLVKCPDNTAGGCWVQSDPNLTLPATPPQGNPPVPDIESIPIITILDVIRDEQVTIQAHDYPADTVFKVRMGKSGTKGIDGIVVDNLNSGNGDTFTTTFDIPEQLQGEKQIAIRLESKNGYYSYNWFDNRTSGSASNPTDAYPTSVKYVMARQDVKMYSGPSKNYRVIGTIADGQIAKVTGISGDGYWWRVICPDGTTGSCWVSAKSKFTRPAD